MNTTIIYYIKNDAFAYEMMQKKNMNVHFSIVYIQTKKRTEISVR